MIKFLGLQKINQIYKPELSTSINKIVEASCYLMKEEVNKVVDGINTFKS